MATINVLAKNYVGTTREEIASVTPSSAAEVVKTSLRRLYSVRMYPIGSQDNAVNVLLNTPNPGEYTFSDATTSVDYRVCSIGK